MTLGLPALTSKEAHSTTTMVTNFSTFSNSSMAQAQSIHPTHPDPLPPCNRSKSTVQPTTT